MDDSDAYLPPDLLLQDLNLGRFDPGLISKSREEYGSRSATIRDVGIFAPGIGKVNVLRQGHRYSYAYSVDFLEDAEDVAFGMAIKTINGIELVGGSTHGKRRYSVVRAGTARHVAYQFTCNFNPGMYFTNAGVSARGSNSERQHLHRILDVIAFRVDPPEAPEFTGGLVWVDGEFMELAGPIGNRGA